MSCIDVTIPPSSLRDDSARSSSCSDHATVTALSPNRPLILVAAAALIDGEGRVLLAERPEGKSMAGLWEFPGGKVNTNETPEAALVRELKEELDIQTSTGCLWPLSFASHGYADFHLLMPVFGCRVWQGTPRGKESQKITWAKKEEWKNYPMPPADIALVQILWELL